MSGERQPGQRPPAPGALALVQAFINSHFDLEHAHGADLLATPADLMSWLERHELPAPPAGAGAGTFGDDDLDRVVTVREGLRALAAQTGGPPMSTAALAELNGAVAGASLDLRFAPDGPRLLAVGRTPIDRALGTLLAITTDAVADGSWTRLKICPGHHCGWAFYDGSRNRTGRWCSMQVCGGRAKAQAHYQRRRQRER